MRREDLCLQHSPLRGILAVCEEDPRTVNTKMKTRICQRRRSFTSGTADIGMSSASGPPSYAFGSGLGPAAAFSLGSKILSLRVTRNPRMNMH
jgi:hypothetical protein